MKVVKSHQRLLGDLADKRDWNALIVILLYHRKEILAKDLQRHHRMSAIWPDVEELVIHLKVVSVLPTHFERGVTQVPSDRLFPE